MQDSNPPQRPLMELGVLATSNLFRSAGPLVERGVRATSNLCRSAGPLLELGVLATSNLCRSAGPRTKGEVDPVEPFQAH
jgi:hypothetical protein